MDELPNDGLIRYRGLFNRERIFVVSPEAAKEFLTTEAYKFIKPELQWILANNVAAEGLLILEGDKHKEARKRFNPVFSPTQMRKWFPSLWESTIEALNEMPSQTKEMAPDEAVNHLDSSFSGLVSILKLVSAASIDMMGHFHYNVDFDAVKNISLSKSAPVYKIGPFFKFVGGYIRMFKHTKRGQFTLKAASIIGPKIALKLPLHAVNTVAGIMKTVRRTAEGIVVDHERGFTQDAEKAWAKDDMLSTLMKSGHFSRRDLLEQTTHFFGAGTETLSPTVCWAIHLISRHPEIQTRLRDEIRDNIPSPYFTSEVTELQFTTLKYLNAVVQEVLRFHSINTVLWRECMAPATIAGVSIPVGTKVVYSPWTLGRDPAHWGPDARSFKPERWLDNVSGGADHSYSFLTFGGGPRRCVGETYARDELLCLVAGLIGRYEFKPIAPDDGSDDGNELGDNFPLTLFKIYEGWELKIKKVPGW